MKKIVRLLCCNLVFSLIMIFSFHSAQAEPMSYLWRGLRPLGMGGAFTAIADDYNAIFYNPAGLERVEHFGLAIINPSVEAGKNGQELYQDIQDTDFEDTVAVTELLRDHMGERQHVRASFFPHLVKKHFGLGILGQANLDMEVNNPQYPEVDTKATVDVGGVLGLGFGFLKDKALCLGLTGKYLHREQLQETYTAFQIASTDFEDTFEDDLYKGTGFGFDLGALYTFPILLQPSVALVIQNIGGLDLGEAGEISQQINLGSSVRYQYSFLDLRAGLDILDLTREVNEEEDDLFRRLHMGAEAKLWKRLALRTGLYQGYGSFGLGLDAWILKFDYACYAEEIGVYAGQRADRRHIIQVALGW